MVSSQMPMVAGYTSRVTTLSRVTPRSTRSAGSWPRATRSKRAYSAISGLLRRVRKQHLPGNIHQSQIGQAVLGDDRQGQREQPGERLGKGEPLGAQGGVERI